MGLTGKQKTWHLGIERAKIDFSFGPAGSGTVQDIRGNGIESIVYAPPSNFLVTFQDEFGQLDCVVGSVQEGTGKVRLITFGAFDKANRTLDLAIYDNNGNPVALGPGPNDRVFVSVTVRDSVLELYL